MNKRQIENNTKWLLTHASLPVKYLTYRDLLKNKSNLKPMKELFSEMEKSDIVKEIFSKQEPDGSWCSGGSWAPAPSYLPKSGHTPVSPKYVTTSWILPILGDLGFSIQDKRIKKAVEYILSFQSNNGYIAESHSNKYNIPYDQLPISPCRFSIILIGLSKVGADNNKEVKNAYNLLLHWQRNDGGWFSSNHAKQMNWNRSCPFASYHGAMALFCSNNLKSKGHKNALLKALNFLIWHLSEKKDTEIQRFFYHGHSMVHELLMLSELNMGLKEKAVQRILEWLMTMYHPDEGCFRYTGKAISRYSYRNDYMDTRVAKYRLFHLIEDDWLTYYITRIMANILKHEKLQ